MRALLLPLLLLVASPAFATSVVDAPFHHLMDALESSPANLDGLRSILEGTAQDEYANEEGARNLQQKIYGLGLQINTNRYNRRGHIEGTGHRHYRLDVCIEDVAHPGPCVMVLGEHCWHHGRGGHSCRIMEIEFPQNGT